MLIESTSTEEWKSSKGDEEPPAALTEELAWCLRRFVTGRADEPAMRRAEQALANWEMWSEGTIDLRSG